MGEPPKRVNGLAKLLDGVKSKFAGKNPDGTTRIKKKDLAVFVDGPNILRKEFNVNLKDIKKILEPYGRIRVGRVFLNQYASSKLVEACANQGFEQVITVGDVDVAMAVDATEAIFNPTVKAIAWVTRDSDYLPSLIKAKKYGKETIAVLVDEASAAAIKNTADRVLTLKKS